MKTGNDNDLRSEYTAEELGDGVRGKYYSRYKKGHNVVVLRPEVAEAFPTDEDVNQALLELIRIARTGVKKTNS